MALPSSSVLAWALALYSSADKYALQEVVGSHGFPHYPNSIRVVFEDRRMPSKVDQVSLALPCYSRLGSLVQAHDVIACCSTRSLLTDLFFLHLPDIID